MLKIIMKITSKKYLFDRKILSWALYDWANSAFAVTVISVFFPIFFKKYWAVHLPVSTSTFYLGIASSITSLIVAILAPILGTISDIKHNKKKLLLIFAAIGIIATVLLYYIGQGDVYTSLIVFIFASIGFSTSLIFYDALLSHITSENNYEKVSALGYSLGYLGGGILFALCVITVLFPEKFGFDNTQNAIKFSFINVSLWWLVFTVPLILFVREHNNINIQNHVGNNIKDKINTFNKGFTQLYRTLKHIKQYKTIFIFLLSYWLYIDGVNTIIRMAVDYGLAIGLNHNNLMVALLITQFVGFPASIIFGNIGYKFGAKKGITIGLLIYIIVTIWAYFMNSEIEFYILAFVIGLVQGGVQALSRAYFTKIIPKTRTGEFLGFYNMVGKFSVILGPALMGLVSYLTNNPRLSIFTVLFFIGTGLFILHRVKDAI